MGHLSGATVTTTLVLSRNCILEFKLIFVQPIQPTLRLIPKLSRLIHSAPGKRTNGVFLFFIYLYCGETWKRVPGLIDPALPLLMEPVKRVNNHNQNVYGRRDWQACTADEQ